MKGKKTTEWKPDRWIFAALRKIWRWSKARKECLKNAERKGKFVCASCGRLFGRKAIAVDHRNPVVDPNTGFQGWDVYIKRLFVTTDELQVLCRANCHRAKTATENEIRRQLKKASNG